MLGEGMVTAVTASVIAPMSDEGGVVLDHNVREAADTDASYQQLIK